MAHSPPKSVAPMVMSSELTTIERWDYLGGTDPESLRGIASQIILLFLTCAICIAVAFACAYCLRSFHVAFAVSTVFDVVFIVSLLYCMNKIANRADAIRRARWE